ncbi:hypothetical protein AMAG_17790 [Allomyces macrogynus ATCC 38327]|uniref:Uncharacterized protein n=1 Tax=Allomyces macrogynus (strain ATCC 38327) TaxID=578462 RepID=A0A0L0RZM5_ALLM3|nr:hypothetical protein AMAG_17790 [Allomyces macrogynus ATCC 38327]|eukprot:KNE55531.1 hypothetical protein AMAG_17790 [Allomyces macrogynus ATCC 38327]
MADRFKSPASTMRRNSSMPSSNGSAQGTAAHTARAPITMPRGSKSFTGSQTMIPTALLPLTNSDVAKDPAGLPPRGVVATAQLLDTEGTALDLRPRTEHKAVTGVGQASRSMTVGSAPLFDPLQTMETLIDASGPLKPHESGTTIERPVRDGATLPLSPVPSGLELPLDDVPSPKSPAGKDAHAVNGSLAADGATTAHGAATANDASTAAGLRPRSVAENRLAAPSGRSSMEVCARAGQVGVSPEPDDKNASAGDADGSLLTFPTSARTALSSSSSGTGVDMGYVDTP